MKERAESAGPSGPVRWKQNLNELKVSPAEALETATKAEERARR